MLVVTVLYPAIARFDPACHTRRDMASLAGVENFADARPLRRLSDLVAL